MLVEIDDKWVRRINSPMGFVAGALSGVSLTFVPAGLFLAGRSMQSDTGVPVAILCFAIVLFTGFFHYKLAQAVMAQGYAVKKGLAGAE